MSKDDRSLQRDTARRARYQHNKLIVIEAKSVPCADCKGCYPYYVMDFDHIRGKKLKGISQMGTAGRSLLLAEIAKCDVVCANCHRIRTFRRIAETAGSLFEASTSPTCIGEGE